MRQAIFQAWLAASAVCILPAQVHAQAQPASIDQVVVTAERTNRTLRDTASSVSVLTGAEVQVTPGVQTTYDALALVPNLVATRSSNNAPAVRGIDGGGPAIGANAFFAGSRPRLNFQVDGRTLTFNEAIYIDGGIWDLQQIEVYEGPQSTLQGRNAVGGVIAIKTADPTFDWQGKARVIVGDSDLQQYSAAVGGPLVGDSLAFRLAADYRHEQADAAVPTYAQLSDPGRYQSLALRGKLLFTPATIPTLRSLLTVAYTDAYAPQTLGMGRPFTDYVVTYPNTPRFETKTLAAISDSSWQLNDKVGVAAFLTGTDFRINRYVNPGNGVAQIHGHEFSAEPRLKLGQATDTLSGFLAGYIFSSRQHEAIDLFAGGLYHDTTLTSALFGEAVWRPSDRVDLTLGARYEQEQRDRTGGTGSGIFAIDYHKTFGAFLPKATLSLHTDRNTVFGVTLGRGYNAGGAGFAFNPPFPSFVYGRETVWNYEGFVRTSRFDGRLNLNANLFYNDYSGLQLPFIVGGTPSSPATVIRNADRATTYGAEATARLHVGPALDLNAAAGLLKTKVNRYGDPNVQGKALPRSPAFTLSAGLVAHPVEKADLSIEARYTDAYYSDVFDNARGRTSPYTIVNAQAAYTLGRARLFLAATNLLDKKTPVLISTGDTAASDIANMTQPRRISAGLEVAF